MEDEYKPDRHDQREINKMSLQTYHMDAELDFDYSIDRLMLQLKKENEKSWADHESWAKMEETDPDRYSTLKEEADRMEISLDLQRYEYIESIYFNDDQLTALAEMKIIYAYKLFEISLKKLLRASLSVNTYSFYKWDTVLNFLNEKGIKAHTLKGYEDILQLKAVNNALKHTDELTKQLLAIPEFRKKERLSYVELDQFYKRVKPAPRAFIESLAYAIYNELYEFDDEKLTNLVNSYVLRMDKDIAYRFIEKLRSSYKD